MRNRFIPFWMSFALVFLLIIIAILWSFNVKYRELNERQQILLNSYAEMDSLYSKGENDLVLSINAFFDGIPTYKNGEKVGPIDFIHYHREILDSLNLYRSYYEHSKKWYGINIRRIYSKDSTSYFIGSDPPTSADTARLLYPSYKNKVYKKGKSWHVVVEATFKDEYYSLYDEHVELVNKYNKTNFNYRDVARKYTEAIEEKANLLNDFAKRGYIKLDTLDGGRIQISYYQFNQ